MDMASRGGSATARARDPGVDRACEFYAEECWIIWMPSLS